jgi:hypothetical protein
MILDDQGNFGQGESKPAILVVPVVVRPVNHAPSVVMPTILHTDEDVLLQLDANLVDVFDADVRDYVSVNLSVATGGLVQLSPQEAVSFKQLVASYLLQEGNQVHQIILCIFVVVIIVIVCFNVTINCFLCLFCSCRRQCGTRCYQWCHSFLPIQPRDLLCAVAGHTVYSTYCTVVVVLCAPC